MIVIDASITIEWFSDAKTRAATALAAAALATLTEGEAIVPALWRWEVQDVLRRHEKSNLLTVTPAQAIAELRHLAITVDDGIRSLFGTELVIAIEHHLSVYDAAYLELALRLDIPLATLDAQLAKAAKTVGLAFAVPKTR